MVIPRCGVGHEEGAKMPSLFKLLTEPAIAAQLMACRRGHGHKARPLKFQTSASRILHQLFYYTTTPAPIPAHVGSQSIALSRTDALSSVDSVLYDAVESPR
jgi:hypothetical protein